jgi:hypothetical protein
VHMRVICEYARLRASTQTRKLLLQQCHRPVISSAAGDLCEAALSLSADLKSFGRGDYLESHLGSCRHFSKVWSDRIAGGRAAWVSQSWSGAEFQRAWAANHEVSQLLVYAFVRNHTWWLARPILCPSGLTPCRNGTQFSSPQK